MKDDIKAIENIIHNVHIVGRGSLNLRALKDRLTLPSGKFVPEHTLRSYLYTIAIYIIIAIRMQ